MLLNLQTIPRIPHIASTMFALDWCLSSSLSAGTYEVTIGSDWLISISKDWKQDLSRCGSVNPITVSLSPTSLINTPTSPIGPHCIANPVSVTFYIEDPT